MASPLRIMHISTRLILGGSQENTVLSCEGQADAGHTVSLVYGPIYGPEGSLLERVKQHGGIDTIETPNLVRDLSPVRDVRCYFDLKRIIAQWQPDVVHTHSSKAGILGRLAAWKARVPCVVHTIHGLAFHPYQTKWRNAIYIASERFAARRCHRIICVADAMRDQALAARIGRRDQYVTVYSGIETEPFVQPKHSPQAMRTELGLAEDDFVLGTIARLAELKGHDDLLDALSPMMHTHPNIKLLWVGDGWWRDRLMKRIQRLGLESQVVLTGLVEPQRIPACLGAMNVLVHPSYREGLPRAVPQALLSGVPTIVYDVDGANEVCIDGEVGRLVPPGDLTALRDAVQWMMDHPTERQEMGQRGRERCKDRFAAARMVKELETIYAQVLAEHGDDRARHRRDRER
ncbi:MAG: glycosyltransferase family 4 protein [Planctomycetes bacterium]|nr:glycosyltransferase family 4 protein [Planctomycetota bacterium]